MNQSNNDTIVKVLVRWAGVCLFFLFSTSFLSAANSSWNGSSTQNWDSAANWSAGIPGPNDCALFSGSPANVVYDPDTRLIGGILLDNTFIGGTAQVIFEGPAMVTISSGGPCTIPSNGGLRIESGSLHVGNISANGAQLDIHGDIDIRGGSFISPKLTDITRLTSANLSSVRIDAAATVGMNLQVTAGTRTASVGVFIDTGSFLVNGGIFNANGVTVSLPSFNISSGTFNTANSSVTVAGNVTLTGGTINGNTGNLTIGSNFINNGGVFASNNSTVTFNGAGTSIVGGSGSAPFFFSLANTAPNTLRFDRNTTVANAFQNVGPVILLADLTLNGSTEIDNNVTINNTHTMIANGAFQGGSTGTINLLGSSSQLRLGSGNPTIPLSMSINVGDGTLDLGAVSGSYSNIGVITVNPGGNITGISGNLSVVDPSPFRVGLNSVEITLTDRGLNLNGGAIDTVTVTVTSAVSGDSETVTLCETSNGSATFTNMTNQGPCTNVGLPTHGLNGSGNNNGTLYHNDDGNINVSFVDPNDATDIDSAAVMAFSKTKWLANTCNSGNWSNAACWSAGVPIANFGIGVDYTTGGFSGAVTITIDASGVGSFFEVPADGTDNLTIDTSSFGITLSEVLRVEGILRISGAQTVQVNGGDVTVVNASSQLSLVNNGYLAITNGGFISNQSGGCNYNANSMIQFSDSSGGAHSISMPCPIGRLNFTAPTTATYTLNSDVSTQGDFSMAGGTLNLGTRTLTLGTTMTKTGGTINAGTSTLVKNGANAMTLPLQTWYNVTINNGAVSAGGGGVMNIDGDFTIAGGSYNAGFINHTVAGSWQATSGSFNFTSGSITFDGTSGSHSIRSNSSSFADFTINASGATYTLSDALSVTAAFVVNNGVFASGTGGIFHDINVVGTFSQSNGTLTLGDATAGSTVNLSNNISMGGGTTNTQNSTLVIAGTAFVDLNSVPFYNVNLSPVGTTSTLVSTMVVNNQLSFGTGNFDQNNQIMILLNEPNSTTTTPLNLATTPAAWNNQARVEYRFSKDSNGIVSARTYGNDLRLSASNGLTYTANGIITVNGTLLISSLTASPATPPSFNLNNNNLIVNGAGLQLGGAPNDDAVLIAGNASITTNQFLIGSPGSYFTAAAGNWLINDNWTNNSTSTNFDWGTTTLRLDAGSAPTNIDNGPVGNNADFPNTILQGTNAFNITGNNLEFRANATLQTDTTVTRTANIIFSGSINNITQNIQIENSPTVASPLVNGQSGAIVNIPFSTPTLSWAFNDADTGDTQGAYRICMGTTAINDAFSNCDQFDSGKILATTTSYVYAGPALSNSTPYHWRVRVYDQLNTTSSNATSTSTNLTFQVVPPALIGSDGPADPAGSNILSDAINIVAHHFQIGESGADPNEVRLNGISINQTGTAAANTITRVRVFADDGATPNVWDSGSDTLLATINNPSNNNLVFDTSAANFDINDGMTVGFFIILDLNNNANSGDTYRFEFVSAAGVQNSVSVGSTAGSNSQSNTFTATWGSLNVADSTNSYPDSNTAMGNGDSRSVLKFSISETSGLENVMITSISFTNSGDTDEDNNIALASLFEFNPPGGGIGTPINSASITGANPTITFSGLSEQIDAGTTRHFYLTYQANVDATSVGGTVFTVAAAGNGIVANTSSTGKAINLSGSSTGRNVALAKPELRITNTTVNPAILIVNAANAQRVVYELNLEELSGNSIATVNEIRFADPTASKIGAWGAADFSNMQLPAAGNELRLYLDNGNNIFEPSADQEAFGAGTGRDLVESGGNIIFSGTPFIIPAGTTAKLFLVAQVDAPRTPFFDDAANYQFSFNLAADCASPAPICVNADTGTAATSDISPIDATTPGDTLTFFEGLVDGQVIADSDINISVPGGSDNNRVMRFRLTNVTPGNVAVPVNGITWNITPNDNSIIKSVSLLDSAGNLLYTNTTLSTHLATFADRTLAGGASEDYFIAIDLTPEAPTGTQITIQVTDATGQFTANSGFPITKADLSVARELNQNLEVRNNYPDFKNNEFALILFKSTSDNIAEIKIYSLSGEVIRDFGKQQYSSNVNQVRWYGKTDAGKVALFGVYFVRIETSGYTTFKRVFVRKGQH